MITPEQRKKLEVEAEAFEGTGYGIYLAGAEALDRLLSTESACVTGCKNFTGGEIRHHKDCAHYPESFSKMYDELETRIQSESSDSDDDRLRGVPGSGIFLMADDTVGESDEEAAAAYWQGGLGKFFPTSKGPTGQEKRMFLAGCARIRSGELAETQRKLNETRTLVEDMLECLSELVDLTEDTRNGEYKPDSFTVQPARTVIARAVKLLSGAKDGKEE